MTDTPTGGWPDPTKPGVPMEPERDGWHWLQRKSGGMLEAWLWTDDGEDFHHWHEDGGGDPEDMARQFAYCGPCLTPSEVQAREAAAWAAGAAAMRAECERVAQNVVDTYEQERILLEGFRALPLPPMPATTQGGNADE